MFFNKLIHSSILFSLIVVLNFSFSLQADDVLAEKNVIHQAQITEEEPPNRSSWVWRNHFIGSYGIKSTVLLGNQDTALGKSVLLADDFIIGPDTLWHLDSLKAFMYWYGQAPDRIEVVIYPDFWGAPIDDTLLLSTTFEAEMPDPLVMYGVTIPVKDENVVLGPGAYWISFRGIYDTSSTEDTCYIYWIRKNILIGESGVLCKDSLGAVYTVPQFNWVAIQYAGETGPNSVKFWIKADVQTSIYSNGFQRSRSLVSVFPNPAAEQVLFQLDNASVKQIEIYDVMGKLVKTAFAKTKKVKVNISSLTNGVYFYNLVDKSGKMVERGKFSVSK